MQRIATLLLILLLPAFLLPEGTRLCICELLHTRPSSACDMSCCHRPPPSPAAAVTPSLPDCCCVVGASSDVTSPAPVAQKPPTSNGDAVALPVTHECALDLLAKTPLRVRSRLDASVRTVPRSLVVPLRL